MSTAERFTDRCSYHGEGPFWDPVAGRLLLVDMLAGAVVAVDAAGGTTRHELGGVAAVIRRRAAGGFVLATEHGFRMLTDGLEPDGEEIRVLDDPGLRMNEGGVDPQGRLHVGTMAYDIAPGAGTLYRLDADRSVQPTLTGLTISNGLQWSADGLRAFHNDTVPGTMSRYAFDPVAGTFADRATVVQLDEATGLPDGLAIDAEGGLWVALWGGSAVHRYDQDGTLTEVVRLPVAHVTACAFGGPDGTTLYISTSRDGWGEERAEPEAGSVFRVETGVRGAPQHAYAG